MRVALALIVTLGLSGCSDTLRQNRLNEIGVQCQEYGHAEGSEAYRNCVQQVDITARNRAYR